MTRSNLNISTHQEEMYPKGELILGAKDDTILAELDVVIQQAVEVGDVDEVVPCSIASPSNFVPSYSTELLTHPLSKYDVSIFLVVVDVRDWNLYKKIVHPEQIINLLCFVIHVSSLLVDVDVGDKISWNGFCELQLRYF